MSSHRNIKKQPLTSFDIFDQIAQDYQQSQKVSPTLQSSPTSKNRIGFASKHTKHSQPENFFDSYGVSDASKQVNKTTKSQDKLLDLFGIPAEQEQIHHKNSTSFIKATSNVKNPAVVGQEQQHPSSQSSEPNPALFSSQQTHFLESKQGLEHQKTPQTSINKEEDNVVHESFYADDTFVSYDEPIVDEAPHQFHSIDPVLNQTSDAIANGNGVHYNDEFISNNETNYYNQMTLNETSHHEMHSSNVQESFENTEYAQYSYDQNAYQADAQYYQETNGIVNELGNFNSSTNEYSYHQEHFAPNNQAYQGNGYYPQETSLHQSNENENLYDQTQTTEYATTATFNQSDYYSTYPQQEYYQEYDHGQPAYDIPQQDYAYYNEDASAQSNNANGSLEPHYDAHQVPAEEADPLIGKFNGHALAVFGPGGKLVLVRPQRQQFFETLPNSAQRKAVQKVLPGHIAIHSVSELIHSAILDKYKRFEGPFIGLESKKKKQNVVAFVEKMMVHASVDDRIYLWKLLKLFIENDGILLGGKDEIQIVAKLRELMAFHPKRSNQASALENIQNLLLDGKRAEACELALSSSLWAHALLIASQVDKATFGKAISQFSSSVFACKNSNLEPNLPKEIDFTPLHVLYGLFGSKGVAAIQDALNTEAPIDWKAILCIILYNRTPNDLVAISTLGDYLTSQGNIDAGHFCYLLCFTHSSVVEIDSSRLLMIHADHAMNPLHFNKNIDAIHLTEIFEYARQLSGQFPLNFLPHFLPYKIAYTVEMADLGLLEHSLAYLESIEQILKSQNTKSKYFDFLLEMVLELMDRQSVTAGKLVKSRMNDEQGWLTKLGSLGGSAIGKGLDTLMSAAVGEKITSPVITERPQRYGRPSISGNEIESNEHNFRNSMAGSVYSESSMVPPQPEAYNTSRAENWENNSDYRLSQAMTDQSAYSNHSNVATVNYSNATTVDYSNAATLDYSNAATMDYSNRYSNASVDLAQPTFATADYSNDNATAHTNQTSSGFQEVSYDSFPQQEYMHSTNVPPSTMQQNYYPNEDLGFSNSINTNQATESFENPNPLPEMTEAKKTVENEKSMTESTEPGKEVPNAPANPGLVASLWSSLWGGKSGTSTPKGDKGGGPGHTQMNLGNELECYFDGTRWIFPSANSSQDAATPTPQPPPTSAPPPSKANSRQASPAPSGTASPVPLSSMTPNNGTGQIGHIGNRSNRRGARSKYVDVLNPTKEENNQPQFDFSAIAPSNAFGSTVQPKIIQPMQHDMPHPTQEPKRPLSTSIVPLTQHQKSLTNAKESRPHSVRPPTRPNRSLRGVSSPSSASHRPPVDL